MFASFVPTRKRSTSCVRPFASADNLFAKKQKLQHQGHTVMPKPAEDNGAQETDQPYETALNSNTDGALADVLQSRLPASGEALPFPDDLLDIPDDLDNMSFCSSDTDIEELGEEYMSSLMDTHVDIYGNGALVGLPDDKKAADLGIIPWLEAGLPSYHPDAETFSFPAVHEPTVNPLDLPASTPYADIQGSPAATPGLTPEQLCALKKFADTSNLDVVVEPDGVKLKCSPLATPDSFLTQAPLGFGVDTGLSEREFTEGPLRMDAESIGSHAPAAGAVVPTQLFPDTSVEPVDFPFPYEPPTQFDGCDPLATAGEACNYTDSELFALLDDLVVEVPKAATEEVTDSDLLLLSAEADGLSEDGTFQLHGRPVTRISSTEFARTRPYDLQVVAEDLCKSPPHAETSLHWCFVIPNRSPKDLNKFFPEKTWTNGGKHKERPGPLNEAMMVQHHGFQPHKLPRGDVPSYLQLDAADRAMLRFSMRMYTRRGVKSCKKAYPTAYVVLTLKKPIRKLRHTRRNQ